MHIDANSSNNTSIRPVKKVIANTIWLTGASLFGRVVSYISFVLVARMFTKEEVGIWAILLTAYLFSEIVSNLGLDKLVIRELATTKEPKKEDNLLSSVLVFKFFSACCVVGVAYMSLLLWYPEISSAYRFCSFLFLLAVPCIAITRSLEAWHTAMENMEIPAIAQIAERIALLVLIGFCWLLHLPFSIFIGISALAPAMRLFVALYNVRTHIHLLMPRDLHRLLKEGFILFAVEAIAGVYMRIDILLISRLCTLADTGVYNIAYRVFEFFTVVFSGYLLAIFPRIARKMHIDAFKTSFGIGLIVVSIAALAGIVLRDYLLGLFGSAYLEGEDAFIALMLALPFCYVTSFLVNYLIAAVQTAVILRTGIIVVISNIALNFFLIPRYAIAGAGMAFLGSELISCGILLFIFWPQFQQGKGVMQPQQSSPATENS